MKAAQLTSEDIKKDIVNLIYWDSRIEASGIMVDVSEGVVHLTGNVQSNTACVAAEIDCLTIPGVNSVVNDLEIDFPEETKIPTDIELLNNVVNTFLCNPDLDSSNIDVTADEGTVILEGTVNTYWQKTLTEQLAFGVAGVVSVENDIFVIPREKVTDEQITEAIKTFLNRKPDVDTSFVDINVEGGTVMLSGKVSSWTAYHEIASTARYLVGVVNLINNINVDVE